MKRMSKRFLIGCLLALCTAAFALPAFAAAPIVIKVAAVTSDNHPDFIAMREVFKKNLEARSGGRIKVELYPNGQLGGDRELIESVQMGSLEIAMPASSVVAGFDPRFQVLDLPFLFKDKKTAFAALDGELGKKLNDGIMSKGFIVLGFTENGFRHVSNNRGPVTKPADLKGLKIRTMENPVHVAFFKLLGANPTPINYGELYTALQQKTVDAMECPAVLYEDGKFYEVQKYLSLTGHVFSVVPVMIGKKFFDGLPKDLQKMVKEEAHRYVLAQRKIIDAEEKKVFDVLKKKGMVINDLTPAQKKLFVQATAPTYEQFRGKIGSDLVDMAIKIANQ